MSRPFAPCGTRAAYVRGCHCAACTKANSAYHRDRHYNIPRPNTTVDALHPVAIPGDWYDRAACAGLPVDWFFLDRGRGSSTEIRAVCESCPVRSDCLEWAITNRIDIGWYGGTSPTERNRRRLNPDLFESDHVRVDAVRPAARFL